MSDDISDRAMLGIAATVWGEKIRPMQATIEMQLSAISELQRENDRLRELFRKDGEQHAAHVRGLLEQHETRLSAYAAENDRLREALTSANGTIVQLSQNFDAENARLRELFRKYINHVAAEEGTTFMPSEHDGFSIEELEALDVLDAEARALAKEAGE